MQLLVLHDKESYLVISHTLGNRFRTLPYWYCVTKYSWIVTCCCYVTIMSYSCGYCVWMNVWLRGGRWRMLSMSCPCVEFIAPQNFLESFRELLAKTPVYDRIYTAVTESYHLCEGEQCKEVVRWKLCKHETEQKMITIRGFNLSLYFVNRLAKMG